MPQRRHRGRRGKPEDGLLFLGTEVNLTLAALARTDNNYYPYAFTITLGASDDLSKGNVLVTEFIGYDGTDTGAQRSGIIKLTYGSYAAAEFVVTQERKP